MWHVNAFAQLLQRLLEAHGVPRGKSWVIGKETNRRESSWRENEELPLSVLVHREGFETKREAKLSISSVAKAQLACDLHSPGISRQVLEAVP